MIWFNEFIVDHVRDEDEEELIRMAIEESKKAELERKRSQIDEEEMLK